MFMFWTVSLMRQRTLQQVQCSHYSGHLVSPHTDTVTDFQIVIVILTQLKAQHTKRTYCVFIWHYLCMGKALPLHCCVSSSQS